MIFEIVGTEPIVQYFCKRSISSSVHTNIEKRSTDTAETKYAIEPKVGSIG